MEDMKSTLSNSTHIMTLNILKGIKECGKDVVFIAISDSGKNKDKIVDEFKEIVYSIHCIDSFFGFHISNIKTIKTLLLSTVIRGKFKKKLNEFLSIFIGNPELIICHSPSLETTIYGDLLKEKYPETKYYLYCSDPIALSGITPEKLSIKRRPFMWCENKSYIHPNRVIYGTKPLMFFQKKLFKKYSNKMYYVDVAGSNECYYKSDIDKKRIIYAGNYYNNIRNIEPLFEAVSETEYILDVYGNGNVQSNSSNIQLHERVSADEISAIQNKYWCTICLLNNSCIQIPGKVFYSMSQNINILIILDGMYKEEFMTYFNEFKRFIICDNNKESIKEALNKIDNTPIDWDYFRKNYSIKKITQDLLNGGLT